MRDEVVLEAGFHFLLDKIPLGILRLPEPACGILRFNKEMGGQLNRPLTAQRLLEEVFMHTVLNVLFITHPESMTVRLTFPRSLLHLGVEMLGCRL